jgi:hypothetical protein
LVRPKWNLGRCTCVHAHERVSVLGNKRGLPASIHPTIYIAPTGVVLCGVAMWDAVGRLLGRKNCITLLERELITCNEHHL